MRMSVEVFGPVIQRSVEEVFHYFADFENSPIYGRTVKTVKETDGSIGVGTVFAEESKIMGKTMKTETVVTGFDPPSEFAYSGTFENGMTEQARFVFEAVEGGVRMHGFADVQVPKVPQFLSPLMAWQMKRQVGPLLEHLRDAIEAAQPESNT